MGTKYELLKRVRAEAEASGIQIKLQGVGIAVDREQTTAVYEGEGKVVLGRKGEDAIGLFVSKTKVPVYAVAGIQEIIGFLYQQGVPVKIEGRFRPIDVEVKRRFDEYVKTYGVNRAFKTGMKNGQEERNQ
jgi:orotate phosphoribosyltransferase